MDREDLDFELWKKNWCTTPKEDDPSKPLILVVDEDGQEKVIPNPSFTGVPQETTKVVARKELRSDGREKQERV